MTKDEPTDKDSERDEDPANETSSGGKPTGEQQAAINRENDPPA